MSTHPQPQPLDPSKYGYTHLPGAPPPIPLEKPPFTMKQIRDAIPAHCFTHSLPISLSYLTLDLCLCLTLLYCTSFMPYFPGPLPYFLWPGYWLLQGVFMTGLFVCGHEAGHSNFSSYGFINNLCGWAAHSLLLTPYWAFKVGHSKHHHFTNNCDHDEIFVPPSRLQFEKTRHEHHTAAMSLLDAVEESPLYNIICMILKFIIFFPAYILFGKFRLEKYEGQNMNLLSPYCVLYSPQDFWGVLCTDLGLLMAAGGCGFWCSEWGVLSFLRGFLAPYFVFNFYFAMGTFLQHTDIMVPRFRDEEWNWMRGALCTVDRSLGFLLDTAFHHIMDTHVTHHLFPKMPFYHTVEATREVKKVLGPYYLSDETPVFSALWRAYKNCKFIEEAQGIVFCKKSLKAE